MRLKSREETPKKGSDDAENRIPLQQRPYDHARVKHNVLYNERTALPGRSDANVRSGHAPPRQVLN